MDDKDKKEFIAFAALAAAAAVFTLAALFLIVSPLITKSYSYAVYGASALLLLCTAAFYFARKKQIRAAARQTPALKKAENKDKTAVFPRKIHM